LWWSPGFACSVFSAEANASNSASEAVRSACRSSHGSRNWTGTVISRAAAITGSSTTNPPPKIAALIRGSTAVSRTPIAVPIAMPPPKPTGASGPICGNACRASSVACQSRTA
jgi:hypothetical protein